MLVVEQTLQLSDSTSQMRSKCTLFRSLRKPDARDAAARLRPSVPLITLSKTNVPLSEQMR